MLSIIIIISIPCPFSFLFLKMEEKTTENNLDYIQFFSSFCFWATCKIDFMCKQITGEFFFLRPIHSIRFILLFFFLSFRRCVSEFINIYFNKHTKSAVSVYVIFSHLSGALSCLQRKQPVSSSSSNSSWHY